MNKFILRKEILKKRDSIDSSYKKFAAQKLVDVGKSNILNSLKLSSNPMVGGYFPIKSEIDVLPLMKSLSAVGVSIALPVMQDNLQMSFSPYKLGDQLIKDKMGVLAPAVQNHIKRLDLLLVPLVSFDLFGGRLGYGKGCYDRYLANFSKENRPYCVGVGYDCQQLPKIELEQYDILMDAILTESNYIIVNKNS
ncbi:5-formyltetrahydrofolate cyclo-ligase [Bartonella sp. DGB1]|uniref:5-formyltetrahydrofolate cyclo-ligase n=1 Tax=Bartonella sp. DGB1 TaxID=3239807 RepID=UPI003523E8E3